MYGLGGESAYVKALLRLKQTFGRWDVMHAAKIQTIEKLELKQDPSTFKRFAERIRTHFFDLTSIGEYLAADDRESFSKAVTVQPASLEQQAIGACWSTVGLMILAAGFFMVHHRIKMRMGSQQSRPIRTQRKWVFTYGVPYTLTKEQQPTGVVKNRRPLTDCFASSAKGITNWRNATSWRSFSLDTEWPFASAALVRDILFTTARLRSCVNRNTTAIPIMNFFVTSTSYRSRRRSRHLSTPMDKELT